MSHIDDLLYEPIYTDSVDDGDNDKIKAVIVPTFASGGGQTYVVWPITIGHNSRTGWIAPDGSTVTGPT